MLSKLWYGGLRVQNLLVSRVRVRVLRSVPARGTSMVPPTQYDTPLPKRMMPATAMVNNWEVIPLFACTAFGILLVFLAVGWAVKNKVDVVFKTHSRDNISRTMNLRCPTIHKVDVVWTTHSRDNISRTMDLRNPTCHKFLTINQKYEPWPEMADALEAMVVAARRLKVRLELARTCVPKP